MQNIEKSLTPAQRARLKAYWHLAITAILTGAIAGLGLIDQFKTIGGREIVVAAVTGAVLAFADGARKYMQASGEPQKAAGVALAESIVAEKAPASPKPTLFGLQVEQAAQEFIAPPTPVVSSNPAVASAETQNTLPDIAVIKSQFAKPVVPTA